jgi:hypothetical protein
MEARIKTQVMTFFKISGFHVRSNVAMMLVEKIKESPENERKAKLDKILSTIQNQNLETANIEEENMKLAIQVSYWNHKHNIILIQTLSGMLPRPLQRRIRNNFLCHQRF